MFVDDNQIRQLLRLLERHNLAVHFVPDRDAARALVLSMIPQGAVVGYGDSLTLRQIGVVDALERGPYTFLNPWAEGNSVEDNIRLKKRALTADVFVTGTNAVTLDGKLVNMDGHGNRVAALSFGPDKVIVVVGINKIVANLDEALKRVRERAAPLNVQRHPHFRPFPPCGVTGTCSDCRSSWRICNKLLVIGGQFDNDRYGPAITVIIVGEELGL
jgi:hypothetical protein